MKDLTSLLQELIKLPKETEWVEFKRNNSNPEEIGEYISALSNAATYHDRKYAYLIWGIDDDSHDIVGTEFDFKTTKVGNENLENWLRRLLSDNANFSFHKLIIKNHFVILLLIYSAIYNTVKFKNVDYIRVGSYKKSLKDHPAMEVQLWHKINRAKFEELIAKQDLQLLEAVNFLDCSSYFELTGGTMPGNAREVMHYLLEDKMVVRQDNGLYAITNLGAILFSKRIISFDSVAQKCVRVIQYEGVNRVDTIREEIWSNGYANGFEGLLRYIEGLLPMKEEIDGGFRRDKHIYPIIAIRELIANALIHQDLAVTGAGPLIEIFKNRIEITNPGTPLIDAERFIDNPPRSRNETLAALMRRAHICEERGSGWDKIAFHCEVYQLPSPVIHVYEDSTKITLFSYIPFNKIQLREKKWACYMHACLKQVSGEQMTNASLRNRFGVSEGNKATVSRLISSAVDDGYIKPLDPNTAPRYMCYIPFWA